MPPKLKFVPETGDPGSSSCQTTAHSLFPPQPGPVALANAYGADMGMVYIYGVLVTIPSVICAGLILPKFLGNLERPTPSFLKADQPVDTEESALFRRFDSGAVDPGDHYDLYHHRQYLAGKDTPAWEVVNFIVLPIAMFIASDGGCIRTLVMLPTY